MVFPGTRSTDAMINISTAKKTFPNETGQNLLTINATISVPPVLPPLAKIHVIPMDSMMAATTTRRSLLSKNT